MSRVGKKPIELGKDLTAEVKGRAVTIKGKKGSLTLEANPEVEVKVEGNVVRVSPRSKSTFADAMAGTTRAHLANMVTGVTKGFEEESTIQSAAGIAALARRFHSDERERRFQSTHHAQDATALIRRP